MKVLLAKPWTGQDPTGWWMSEKFDGVRAIWTGEDFYSRNGNVFHAPDWFKALMPPTPLDGELFVGRGEFQRTVSIVRSQKEDKGWKDIVFFAFDCYPFEGESMPPFEERQAKIRELASSPVFWARQVQCRDVEHLVEFADKIYDLGGEGVMLRQPGSLYEHKRSSTLLKVKRFFDTEAKIIGTVPGKGKHKGRLGALSCATEAGVTFEVGTGFTDEEREREWPLGAVITVRYQELTKDGVPRFPVFVAERDYE